MNADTQTHVCESIYSNGTESNILLRSLQRALYEPEHRNGRRHHDSGKHGSSLSEAP